MESFIFIFYQIEIYFFCRENEKLSNANNKLSFEFFFNLKEKNIKKRNE